MPESRRSRTRLLRRLRGFGASMLGGVLVGAIGWTLTSASFVAGLDDRFRPVPPQYDRITLWAAESLARFSFDVPFLFRFPATPREVCIVYLDEKSAAFVRDRRKHAQLIRRFTEAKARAVIFDIVFNKQSEDPGAEDEFIAAIKENGRVILGGAFQRVEERTETQVFVKEERVTPAAVYRKAAAGWGLLTFRPVDPDYGVRKIYTGEEHRSSATWLAATQLGGKIIDTPEDRAAPRWINYYGPHDTFASVSYDHALDPAGSPLNFFHDRVVFIGARPTLSALNVQRDQFATPYSRFSGQFADGVEVHATIFLNLLRGDWLVRLEPRRELWIALGFGALLGAVLPLCRPNTALLLAILAAVAVLALVSRLLDTQRTWFAWGVPLLVQTPAALVWAIGARYFLEERRRTALREAFGHYLSPQMADQIADADFDLSPGGEVVEATIMFSDLQGFTGLSEDLDDPRKVSEVLIAYFTNTTRHVLENKGTIIKYIGDAVMAVWGAPLPDPNQAVRATLAAWRMHKASGEEVLGHKLITRVGIHTGEVLAGNLGSAYRFDYTCIGDAVNFASRLEGLNKYLGTRILISDATVSQLNGQFITRRLGDFKVVGKDHTVGIHELTVPRDEAEPMPWLEAFAAGTAAFCRGDLDEAERRMQEVRTLRGGQDGPAEFYLHKIEELRIAGLPKDWTGAIEMMSK